MKVFSVAMWVLVFSFLLVVSSFAHCGKNHSKQVEDMTSAQLQQHLVEANIASDTFVFEKMLREKDAQRAQEKIKEKEERDKSLDELIQKLKIDK